MAAEKIENVIVKSENEKPIYLKDFAKVTYGFEERTSYARSNGLPVISLDVIKRRGANIIFASQKIQQLIKDDKIVVWSSEVKEPVAVRFAWAHNPSEFNLYNKEGLPAIPFRTDDWKGVTDGKTFEN